MKNEKLIELLSVEAKNYLVDLLKFLSVDAKREAKDIRLTEWSVAYELGRGHAYDDLIEQLDNWEFGVNGIFSAGV